MPVLLVLDGKPGYQASKGIVSRVCPYLLLKKMWPVGEDPVLHVPLLLAKFAL